MFNEKEITLLKHLRQDSRKSLTKISKETNIPVSTLFEILKRLESKVITRHVSLVDFSKLGYSLQVNYTLNAKNKKELKEFLLNYPNVNSLSTLINGFDFYVECFFRDLKEMNQFKEKLEKFEIKKIKEIFIIDQIKKESFQI